MPALHAHTSVDACVLYDSSTGRINHVHYVSSYGLPKTLSDGELEARCIRNAQKLGHDVSRTQTVRVKSTELKPGIPYKVDVLTRRLLPG
jgi:hypothetical protein